MDAVWGPEERHRYPAVVTLGVHRTNVPVAVVRAALERDRFTLPLLAARRTAKVLDADVPLRAALPVARPGGPSTSVLASALPKVRVGALVRVRLPGKQTKRSYRVERVGQDDIELREMWRDGSKHLWVQSNESRRVRVDAVAPLEVVRAAAPAAGEPDEPAGTSST
jgi:hypothetical protein